MSHHPQILEQVPTHSLGFEALLGDLARRFAMPSIITVDLVNGVGCGVDVVNGEQTLARRDRCSEGSVLCDHWLARSEVASVPLAEPAAAKSDILILGHGELTARGLYVVTIRPERIERHRKRRYNAPAVPFHERDVLVVGLQGKLKGLRRSGRQVDEPGPF